jgi:hypothetical protein
MGRLGKAVVDSVAAGLGNTGANRSFRPGEVRFTRA